MPGKHSAKQKRQAKHIAASERARGKSPEEAELLGHGSAKMKTAEKSFQVMSLDDYYDAVTKAEEPRRTPHGEGRATTSPKLEFFAAHEGSHSDETPHGTYEVHQKQGVFGKKHRLMYYPMSGKPHSQKLSTHSSSGAAQAAAQQHHEKMTAVNKADGQPAAPAPQGSGPPKKFPRRDKTPNVLGKPTAKALSNPYASLIGPEAVAAGEKKDKEIDERSRTRDRAWIAANPKPKTKKALSTGYGKVSGGGALKAPNRGFPVKKGPGDFKPTPIAARTSQASQRSSAPKKPGLEIGEVTVTPMPKKPVNLEIGDVKVTPMPKKPVNLEIGPATVTSLGPPKPTQVAARKALRLSINDLNRAVTAQPSASPPPVPGSSKRPYLPGVHPVSAKPKFKRDAGSFMGMPAKKPGKSLDAQRPKTSSKKSPRALDGGGAALMGSMPPPTLTKPNTVVQKSKGTSMSKTNFNNLFKSELGIPNDEVLCACPHCDSPITKSDLVAKAGDDMVVNQNKKGGMMRGGEGRGVISPSRGVAGAHQTDEVRMVGDKSKKKLVSKGHDDDASSDGGDVDKGDGPIAGGMQTMGPKTSDAGGDKGRVSMRGVAQAQGEKPPTTQVATLTGRAQGPGTSQKPPQVATKSMPIIRGTEWVQYVDDGSDASIAKSIAEAQGQLGQQATQPMDLNNDLSRLLV